MAASITTKRKDTPTAEAVEREIRAGHIAPVYLLMGDEDYYIDHIEKTVVDATVPEDQRDFNLTVFYGSGCSVEAVMDACRRYPLMAERQTVVVREAASLSGIDGLLPYVLQPNPATTLVLCHKHGTLDARKKLGQAIKKSGVVFESARWRDYQLPSFVSAYLKERSTGIEPAACALLCESVGSDLTRLAQEMDKLLLAMPDGVKNVSVKMVASCVGISHEYNSFELAQALSERNTQKAMRIVMYFCSQPKSFSLQATIATLFNLFSNTLLAWYSPDRTAQGIAAYTGMPSWQVEKNLVPTMRNYSAKKLLQILRFLRVTDAKSKGVECPATPPTELLQDLIYFILH